MPASTNTSQRKLVLATSNAGKISEMRSILADLDVAVLAGTDVPDWPSVEEDQPDLQGNALKKAREWHRATGIMALADDTGLEVPYLGGAPGVRSARYAGEDGDSDANITKLLFELRNATESDRSARFRCVIAIVSADGEWCFEGICPGTIAAARAGEGGFGYDPVFVPDGFTESFAQIPTAAKNKISHRGIAVRAAADFLRGHLR
ncbi:MAG: RdgB/HAM1 family non-canonical purine NTP pyrophosphatase [Rhodothermales bacterium]